MRTGGFNLQIYSSNYSNRIAVYFNLILNHVIDHIVRRFYFIYEPVYCFMFYKYIEYINITLALSITQIKF